MTAFHDCAFRSFSAAAVDRRHLSTAAIDPRPCTDLPTNLHLRFCDSTALARSYALKSSPQYVLLIRQLSLWLYYYEGPSSTESITVLFSFEAHGSLTTLYFLLLQ